MIIYIFLALLIGVVYAIYMPMNAAVSSFLGSPITANIFFYAIALITTLIFFAFFGDIKTISNIKNVPPYLFLTGFISAVIVLSITFLIPQIGIRKLLVLSVTGQIIMAMIISHYGVLESPVDPINFKKIFGAVLLILGVIISVT